MNMRRLPIVLALTLSGWAMGCSDTPQADNPPQPTGSATATAAPTAMETAAPTEAPAVTAAPTATAEAVTPPPAPPKAGKEKIVGKWQFSFEGEPKAKAEEEAKKKFPKDEKKAEAHVKSIEEAAAGEWIEFSADTYTSHVTEKGKDKVVLEVKYEIVKDDNTTLVTKPGKDKPKVGKAPPAGTEITTTFKDDNTIEMMDPVKKIKLVFKRK